MLNFLKVGTTFRANTGTAPKTVSPPTLRTPPPGSEIPAWGPTRNPQGQAMSVLKPGAGSRFAATPQISPNEARAQAAHGAPAAPAASARPTMPGGTEQAHRQAVRRASPDIRRAQRGASFATR